MAIRSDSWSSTTAVFALTRYLTEGENEFNANTRPTGTEVEGFIDEVSGMLNAAIREHGFAPSAVAANSTCSLSCDAWVRTKVVALVEMVNNIAGVGGDEESPARYFGGLLGAADRFVGNLAKGWKREGVTVADPTHQGLAFTGLTLQDDRVDPDNTGYEQPKFKRGLFDY